MRMYSFVFFDWRTNKRVSGQSRACSADYVRGMLVQIYGRTIDVMQIDEV